MRVSSAAVIRLAREPVDFRRSIDGLAAAVAAALGRDPMNGELFLFRNRRRNAIKALYWTRNGFVMVYKRLERRRFHWPDLPADSLDAVVSPEMLQALLDGLSLEVKVLNTTCRG